MLAVAFPTRGPHGDASVCRGRYVSDQSIKSADWGVHVSKSWMIIAALVALTMAGCGSSKSSTSEGSTTSPAPEGTTASQTSGGSGAGHTSEWNQAQTKEAERELTKESQGEGLSAAFKQCLIKGVEETFSPAEYKKDSTENKEANKARGVAEACAKKYPPKGTE